MVRGIRDVKLYESIRMIVALFLQEKENIKNNWSDFLSKCPNETQLWLEENNYGYSHVFISNNMISLVYESDNDCLQVAMLGIYSSNLTLRGINIDTFCNVYLGDNAINAIDISRSECISELVTLVFGHLAKGNKQ
jgi:hypothetical protein